MLTIKREGTQVILNVASDIRIERNVFAFTFNCANEYSAALLEEHLRELLNDTVEAMRKAEYNAGWDDAKKRKEKRDWFSIYFDNRASV